jgi:hypothetical protein
MRIVFDPHASGIVAFAEIDALVAGAKCVGVDAAQVIAVHEVLDPIATRARGSENEDILAAAAAEERVVAFAPETTTSCIRPKTLSFPVADLYARLPSSKIQILFGCKPPPITRRYARRN